MDLDVYANNIRNMIMHENELENKRINWLIIFNGILISGFIHMKGNLLLGNLIAVVGIAISVSFWWSLLQGNRAVNFLIKKWEEKLCYHNRNTEEFPPVAGIPYYIETDSKYKGQKRMDELGRVIGPSRLISPIFILTWMILILCNFAPNG